jgi:hypothetical protein
MPDLRHSAPPNLLLSFGNIGRLWPLGRRHDYAVGETTVRTLLAAPPSAKTRFPAPIPRRFYADFPAIPVKISKFVTIFIIFLTPDGSDARRFCLAGLEFAPSPLPPSYPVLRGNLMRYHLMPKVGWSKITCDGPSTAPSARYRTHRSREVGKCSKLSTLSRETPAIYFSPRRLRALGCRFSWPSLPARLWMHHPWDIQTFKFWTLVRLGKSGFSGPRSSSSKGPKGPSLNPQLIADRTQKALLSRSPSWRVELPRRSYR